MNYVLRSACYALIPFSMIGAIYHIHNGDKATAVMTAVVAFAATFVATLKDE